MSRVERGEISPTVSTVERVLDALGVTLHDLADALDEVNGRSPPLRVAPPVGAVAEEQAAYMAARQLADETAARRLATAMRALELIERENQKAGGSADERAGQRRDQDGKPTRAR